MHMLSLCCSVEIRHAFQWKISLLNTIKSTMQPSLSQLFAAKYFQTQCCGDISLCNSTFISLLVLLLRFVFVCSVGAAPPPGLGGERTVCVLLLV